MKKIKNKIALLVAGLSAIAAPLVITMTATAPLALTGCVAVSGGGTNSQAQIDATALILQSTARAGAIAAITPPTGDTNNRAYFQLASQALGIFLTGTNYSPVAFQQALVSVNVPQANNVWVQLGISAVIDLYQMYFSQYVQGQVNGNVAAGTFLLAVQTGFNQALGNAPITASLAKPKALSIPLVPRPLKR